MNHVVLGAFYGDEGKGQCVNNLCQKELDGGNNVLVVRFSGGHQVGHNVKHSNLTHCFSNFGSGTLLGVPTYWSEYCTVDPMTALLEYSVLKKVGCEPKITYSPKCQIILPFDVWGQWGDSENLKHGSVGTGYKKCLDRVKAGYGITILETMNLNVLREKIRGVMSSYYKMTNDPKFPVAFDLDNWCTCVHTYFWKLATLSWELPVADSYIFEGSQGILLDQDFGIMPHCTPSYTTSRNVWALLSKATDRLNTKVHLVCRPYITRHGNGPLCSNNNTIPVSDTNNPFNYYQGTMRGCEFDVDLLAYSYTVDSQFHQGNPADVIFSNGESLSTEKREEIIRNISTNPELSQLNCIQVFEYEKWLDKINI